MSLREEQANRRAQREALARHRKAQPQPLPTQAMPAPPPPVADMAKAFEAQFARLGARQDAASDLLRQIIGALLARNEPSPRHGLEQQIMDQNRSLLRQVEELVQRCGQLEGRLSQLALQERDLKADLDNERRARFAAEQRAARIEGTQTAMDAERETLIRRIQQLEAELAEILDIQSCVNQELEQEHNQERRT